MSGLVMALRCIDGIVLGGDEPFRDIPENERTIRQLSESVSIVVHDDRRFGNWLIDEFLASSPKLDVSIREIAEQAHTFLDSKCQELAEQDRPVTLVGMIIAGITEHGTGEIEFYGLHVGRRFEPRAFAGNVFGGEYNPIARLLDGKIHTFSIGVEKALQLAAFYFTETRSIPALKLEPNLSLATITYTDGLRRVDQEQVNEYLREASRWSENLFAACASTFLHTHGRETEKQR